MGVFLVFLVPLPFSPLLVFRSTSLACLLLAYTRFNRKKTLEDAPALLVDWPACYMSSTYAVNA